MRHAWQIHASSTRPHPLDGVKSETEVVTSQCGSSVSRSAAAKDAPEADVTRGCVDRFSLPGRRPVTQAVARGAEVRATLDHSPGNVRAGTAHIETVLGRVDTRIAGHTTGPRLGPGVDPGALRRVVVGRPLPNVPGRVIEPVAVWRE